jgi:hypothetical protein
VEISLVCKHAPDEHGRRLLDRLRAAMEGLGMTFIDQVGL